MFLPFSGYGIFLLSWKFLSLFSLAAFSFFLQFFGHNILKVLSAFAVLFSNLLKIYFCDSPNKFATVGQKQLPSSQYPKLIYGVSSSNACQLLISIQHLQAESNFSWTVGAAYITWRQKESLRAFQQLFTFFAGNHIYSAEETIPEPRVCCHFFASRGPPIKNPL